MLTIDGDMPDLPEDYEWGAFSWPDKWGNEAAIQHIYRTTGENRGKALCGVRPSGIWGFDLMSQEFCERCFRSGVRQGLPLKVNDVTHAWEAQE